MAELDGMRHADSPRCDAVYYEGSLAALRQERGDLTDDRDRDNESKSRQRKRRKRDPPSPDCPATELSVQWLRHHFDPPALRTVTVL